MIRDENLKPLRSSDTNRALGAWQITRWNLSLETDGQSKPDRRYRAVLIIAGENPSEMAILEHSPEELRDFARELLNVLPHDFQPDSPPSQG